MEASVSLRERFADRPLTTTGGRSTWIKGCSTPEGRGGVAQRRNPMLAADLLHLPVCPAEVGCSPSGKRSHDTSTLLLGVPRNLHLLDINS